MSNPRSAFPGVVTQRTSPRVAANTMGHFLTKLPKVSIQASVEHLPHRARHPQAFSSRKIPRNIQNSTNSYSYLRSLLDSISVQTTHITVTLHPADPPGFGLTNTTTSQRTGRKNSPTFASMGENFQPVDVAGSRRVQVGIQKPASGLRHHQSRSMLEEIRKLLERGAIQEVSEDEGFYSTLFLIPKKDGQLRPVINLRPLNQFLTVSKWRVCM